MNYFQEIDALLTTIILGGEEEESNEEWLTRVKKEIKEIILESYRNGQKAGPRKDEAAPARQAEAQAPSIRRPSRHGR